MFKKILFILVAFLNIMTFYANSATIPTQASGNYTAYCQEQWTKRGVLDQSMYNYCVGKDIEGYQNLSYLVQKYNNLTWIQKAINDSVNKRTKKGSRQDSMVYYSLNQMIDGWEELSYQSKQPNFNKARYQMCQQKWDFDFNMVLYCYKQD